MQNGSLEQPDKSPEVQPEDNPKRRVAFINRFPALFNRYFLIFLALIIIVGFFSYSSLNKAAKQKKPTAQSLSDQQISALKGSTTLVGDSQQTLDVQSNSVFEGSMVLRKNLDVAGSIKVGGGLSLPTITIGGNAGFGSAQVNNNLTVIGNTTLQGQVSLQKNLAVAGSGSFNSLSTSQLNVSSLQLTGDLTLAHHIVATGSVPAKSNGTALGSGGTASLSGNDTAGTVTINTGSSPPAGCFISISFNQKFASTPKVIISPSNSASGSINYYTNRSNTGFSICDSSSPANAATYVFAYFIVN